MFAPLSLVYHHSHWLFLMNNLWMFLKYAFDVGSSLNPHWPKKASLLTSLNFHVTVVDDIVTLTKDVV